jgi:anti-sigma factor RsiW
MKCNQMKKRFSDYLIGEIDDKTRKEIQEHVGSCDSCREELENLSAIWTKLEVLPEEQPSNDVRKRFYATLEEYKQDLAQEKERPRLGQILDGWLERLVPRRPVYQFSLALLFLAVGLAAGILLRSNWQRGGEIAQLRQELSQIRQITAVSLLRQESLREQLREVGWSSGVNLPDEETLADFLQRVAADKTSPSALTAINALFPQSPAIREELARSLSEKTSPLVEIALAVSQHVSKF